VDTLKTFELIKDLNLPWFPMPHMVVDLALGDSMTTENILYNSFNLLFEALIQRASFLDKQTHHAEDDSGQSVCPCHDVLLPNWAVLIRYRHITKWQH
jgi:hypothetical protein